MGDVCAFLTRVDTAEAFGFRDETVELTGMCLQRASEVSAHALAAGHWNY
ncbi:hypothetical protein [Shewanella halifaxensis]|nr:hypothetical protein [Shewanella halifaxensis]